MAGLAEFRNQYPQYADIPDADLADSLHAKFYSDIPKDKYLDSLGLGKPSLMSRAGSVLSNFSAPAAPVDASEQARISGLMDAERAKTADRLQPRLNMPGSVMDRVPVADLPISTTPESQASPVAPMNAPTYRALEAANVSSEQAAATPGVFGTALRQIEADRPSKVERIASGKNIVAPTADEMMTRPAPEPSVSDPDAGLSDFGKAVKFGFEAAGDSANPIIRGVGQGIAGMGQASAGLGEIFADITGDPDLAESAKAMRQRFKGFEHDAAGQGEARQMTDVTQARNSGARWLEQGVQNASNSITRQIPGLLTGRSGAVLAQMFFDSLGNEYGEAKAKGKGADEALARASVFATFEVLGEKLGLDYMMPRLRQMSKGVATEKLPEFFAGVIKRELPGELFTHAGQSATDASAIGLRPGMTLEQYLSEIPAVVRDTLIQTGMMTGAGSAMNAGVGRIQAANQDLTAGVQFDPGQIDAAARLALDPANAQMRIAVNPVPRGPRAELDAVLNDTRPVEEILAEQAQQADLQKQEESDLAYQRRAAEAEAAKSADFARAKQQQADLTIDQANALTRAQGFDDPAPTAMQIAMQRAAEKRNAGDGTRAAPVKAETAEHVAIAELQVDTQPTEAQKDAGNYKLGHLQLQGMDIAIENPAGSVRSGVDKSGKPWANVINHTYGYIKGATAADGDKLDAFIGPDPQSQAVYVIDQIDPDTGRYDEGKVMLGFSSTDEAQAAYLSNYDAGWRGLGAITPMHVDAFKAWIAKGDTHKPLAYKRTEPAAPAQTPAAPSSMAQPEPVAAAPTPKQLEMKARAARRNQEGTANAAEKAAESQMPAVPQEARQRSPLPAEVANVPPHQTATEALPGQQRPMVASAPVPVAQESSRQAAPVPDAAVQDQGSDRRPAIARTKAGKLEITGFSREDVAGSLKTAGIKATVAVGQDGRVLVTAVGRTGNFMPMPIKQAKAIETALLGKTAKAPKARKFTGNLRNDVNLIAQGLYAEVARGGDGEAMGLDMSLVAEQLKAEGFMLPTTDTGKDSDAVIDLIRQDIANGGGTLNERRQTEAMDSEEKKAARVEMLRLADEYGIETRVGITWRAADAVLSEIEAAITKEIGILGRDIAAITKDGVAAGAFAAEEAKQLAIDIASGYRGDQRRDARVTMNREIAEKLQERINEHESAASRETGGRSGEGAGVAAEAEARPTFDLAGQTESEIRAEQERVAAAEAQRLKDEQAAENKRQADAERGSFNLTGSDRPADTLAAQGQGGLFDAAPTTPADRRKDGPQRKRIEHMTPEEMRKELLTDALTGIGNRRAYDEADKLPVQVSIDADSLKWINDNLGHHAGDESLKLIASAIAAETDQAFHLSGDEFAIQANTEDDAARIMAAVQNRLNGATLEAEIQQSGEIVTLTLGVSYGTGKDLKSAERGLQEHKQAREREGLRAARGEQPPGATRSARLEGGTAEVSPDNAGQVADKTLAEASLGDLLRAAADKADGAPKPKKPKATDPMVAIREFYTPGNIIYVDYWKQHDKVLAFNEKEPGNWSVTVQQVEKKGDEWVPAGEVREHSTNPGKNKVVDRVAQPDAGQTEEASDTATDKESPAVGAPIADFGEKIGGAKKDIRAAHKDAMQAAEKVDISAEPLSKSWPAPDYQALIDAGSDPWVVAFMRSARDAIPRKPSKSWKLKGWVAQVELLRKVSNGLLNGLAVESAKKQLTELAEKSSEMRRMASRIELYELVGHRQSLDGVSLNFHHYALYKGEKNVSLWTVEKEAAATAFSNWPREIATGDTKEEVLSKFKALYDNTDLNPPAAKEQEFIIYVQGGKYYVGKKLGRNPAELAGPFVTVAEARAYRTDNADALAEKLAKFKEIPRTRRESNEPRVGEDMRNGQDVTPEMFMESFGFRGVEFGNWVEQKKRQKDLNEAFDALMDMAAIIGVPARALSLNGELGLAFGARGNGGVEPAAAHYESDKIVINLTKKAGAGSLGHEFFHALDNYFSRLRGKGGDFTTEALDVSLASRQAAYHSDGAIRKEMVEAFGAVMRAIRNTALKARSSKLDAKRSKSYWTTDREMVARAFESYLISKLQDQNASNDYLANIVDEETWAAAEKLGFELDESYPYPTAGEVPVIRAGFDNFFQTIKTKETDKGIALESRDTANRTSPAAPITDETPTTIRAGLSRSLGKVTVDRLEQSGLLRILDTADSLPDGQTISDAGTALYDGKTAYLIADRMKPENAIREALHEIGEHHGLEGMLGEKGYKTLTNRVRFMEKAGDKRVRQAFNFVRDAYPELREDSPVFMKEVLANIGQEADVRAKPWWKEMIAAVRRFLVKLGYGGMIRTGDIENMVLYSLKTAAQGNQSEDSRDMVEAMASKVGADKTAFKAVDTESAEFKAWANNAPIKSEGFKTGEAVVIRGQHASTYGDITEFKTEEQRFGKAGYGFYFSDAAGANLFAEYGEKFQMPRSADGEEKAVKTYPVFIAMRNPLVVDHVDDLKPYLDAGQKFGVARGIFGNLSPDAITKLQKQGYDGIISRETTAPKVHKTQGLKILDRNDPKATSFPVFVAFRPEQIKSAISNTGAFSATNPSILESRQGALPNTGATPPAPPTRQTPMALQGGAPGNRASWNGYEPSKLDDVIRTLQDKQIDSKRTVQAIKAAGRQVADKWDVYLQETLFHGRAAKRTLEFVETELNPLAMELKARGLSMAQLEEFLHARHAEEANALIADRNPAMPDGGSGMTNQQAQDYFAQLDPALRNRLEAVARRVDAIIAGTRQLYVSYGLESQETVDGWADTFQHYVPLMREDKDGGMGIGQGFSVKGKETKSRTGSTRTVVDILANIAMQRERAIVRGEKNRVATALMGLAKLNPNPDFWTFDRVPHEQVFNAKTGLVEDRPDPMFKTRDNVIVAKIADGRGGVQERAVVFNEDNEQAMHMVRALKNLDAAQLEGLIGATAKLTRYFASINTQYNPIFGVTNLVRDVQDAMLNLTSTPIAGHKTDVLKHTLGALRGIYIDTRQMRKGQPATSAYAQLWEEFQHEGGQTGYRDMFRTSADRAHAIEKMIDPHGWTDSPLGKVFTAGGMLKVPLTKAQDIAGPLFDWLSDYNESMENATRLAAYKVGKEQGMSNQQAAAMAKGLTVNFNKRGGVGLQVGALYAFFNASMQGTGRIAETLFTIQGNDAKTIRLSATGQKIVAGGILLGSMQALMLAAMGFGDDEPPEFVRERNTIIPIGGKKYITIPMPLGFAILPNIGRVSTEFVLGGFKSPAKHVARLMGIMADAFNPVGGNGTILQIIAPTALDPAVALAENKDWTKKPIAKVSYDKTTPGHKLWKDTASTPSKWIAEAINTMSGGTKHVAGAVSPTPDQIDYLFGQVTGGVGREAVKLEQSIMATATGEDLPPHKIPLVGRFYGDAEAQSSQASTFYNNINRINEYEAEIKGRRKEGRGSEVPAFIAENPEARLVLRANHTERLVQKLRKEKHDLIEKDAPRGRVKIIETRIKAEMEKFNRAVEASKQRQKEAA